MDELRERRMRDGQAERPRIASLITRVDAGELNAIWELERRLHEDYRELKFAGMPEIAEAVWDWGVARIKDVERAGEYAELEDDAEAPARWLGLRVRVSYIAQGGTVRPSQLVGRLIKVTDRGVLVHTDELEEERDAAAPNRAGTIARRVTSERFLSWSSLLTAQPLPVRADGEVV